MKKRISLVAVWVLMLSLLCLPASAAQGRNGYVLDAAELMPDEFVTALDDQAAKMSELYQCGVYIITVDDFTDYSSASDAYGAAKELYRACEMGYGSEKSGVLLLLSVADRDYALIAYGYGNTAFTDYGKEKLKEVFLDDFKKDDWYGGFSDYLNKCESMLASARAGSPLDKGTNPAAGPVGLVISLVLSAFLAFVVCTVLKSSMQSVHAQTEADVYLRDGSLNISRREDRFTYATTQRVKRETKSSSGSSGGTTVDSDGFSGSSGKF